MNLQPIERTMIKDMNATSPLSFLIQIMHDPQTIEPYGQVLATVIRIYGLCKKKGEMLDSEYKEFHRVEPRFYWEVPRYPTTLPPYQCTHSLDSYVLCLPKLFVYDGKFSCVLCDCYVWVVGACVPEQKSPYNADYYAKLSIITTTLQEKTPIPSKLFFIFFVSLCMLMCENALVDTFL